MKGKQFFNFGFSNLGIVFSVGCGGIVVVGRELLEVIEVLAGLGIVLFGLGVIGLGGGFEI